MTIAYRNKQRMRFIDPISLYIFVSAVFFLIFFSFADKRIDESKNGTIKFSQVEVQMGDGSNIDTVTQTVASGGKSNEGVRQRENGLRSDAAQHAFFKGILRNIPKLVFFMIPVMAVILKLFFARRKSLFFVDHGIFSLHFHTFWFSLMLFMLLIPGTVIAGVVANLLVLAGIVYFVLALKNTYSIGFVRALIYSIGVGVLYSLVLLGLSYAGAMYVAYRA